MSNYNPNWFRLSIILPIPFLGLNVYILLVHEVLLAIFLGRISKKILYYPLFLFLFFGIVFAQHYMLSGSTYSLFGVVTNPDLRTYDAMGIYTTSGQVEYLAVFKTLIYVLTTILLFSNINSRAMYYDLISKLIYCSVISSLLVYVISTYWFDGLKQFAMNAPNFLTEDDFGYRISGFFYEPSQQSLLVATASAVKLQESKDNLEKTLTIMAMILIFILSRSMSMIIVFGIVLIFMKYKKVTSLLILVSALALSKLDFILTFFFESSNLFRSLLARTVDTPLPTDSVALMLGMDFGSITTFLPLYGLFFQVGILGVFILCCVFYRALPLLILGAMLFSLSPRLWYFDIYPVFLLLCVWYFRMSNADKRYIYTKQFIK